jgi:hypothetical protein
MRDLGLTVAIFIIFFAIACGIAIFAVPPDYRITPKPIRKESTDLQTFQKLFDTRGFSYGG